VETFFVSAVASEIPQSAEGDKGFWGEDLVIRTFGMDWTTVFEGSGGTGGKSVSFLTTDEARSGRRQGGPGMRSHTRGRGGGVWSGGSKKFGEGQGRVSF
jgi:hypothetical protein